MSTNAFGAISDLVLKFGLRETLTSLIEYVKLYSAGNGLLGVDNGFLIELKNDLQNALTKYEEKENEYYPKK